ncbi:class I SAM-dependent methyltransferase [uncultured Anaerococcus sp.]|uniref:class I SAM-dependent methyltransferase n=1 Tax=uncultured Anaerococcus sp. TaxID=293428 RepID=UPI0025DE487C|nr:class I SAM-dependent methyltransferase [uncultured Anaerococcus sp.]
MTDKVNKNFWDKFAKLYAPFMKKDQEVYDKVCESIIPYLNKEMDVLELACGSGQLSFSLSKHTKSWLATDFSEQMIIEAKKRGQYDNLTFETADATALSYVNEKFDCVLISNALHIMPKPDWAMKEIHRVLKANGILFAPTFLWKEGKERKIKKTLMSTFGFKMYQEWNKEQFEKFVEEQGFSVVEMNLLYGALAPIGVLIAEKVS